MSLRLYPAPNNEDHWVPININIAVTAQLA